MVLTITLCLLAAILLGALDVPGSGSAGDVLQDAGFVIRERRGIGLSR
ncbi:MAG: hypothetical protein AAFP86_06430 [Planctomycetota bacterium]